MGITHSKVSLKSDSEDASRVRASDWNDSHLVDVVAPSGLTGATTAARFVGGTTTEAPVTGTFAVGDYVVAQDGFVHICTVAGSPGEWAAAGGTGNADRLWVPGSDPYGLDDEFNDASIDASWILVDPSPVRATWLEGADVLSCYTASGNGSGQYNAIMKPISLSPPVTFETAIRYMTPYAYAYFMHGVIVSDSATWGSGKSIDTRNYTANDQAVAGYHDLHYQSPAYNSDTAYSGSNQKWQWTGSTLYSKLVWSAANTWSMYISPDGVSWITISSNWSQTVTPTYAGLFTSTWAGGSPCIASYEYFRVY